MLIRIWFYPLRLDRETMLELEESLVLVGVGVSNRREPNEIFSDQRTGLLKTNNTNAIQDSVNLSYKIRNSLLKGEVSQLGSLLSVGWEQKKKHSKKISSSQIDKIYEYGIKTGARGGKLLGAGGGGFLLFAVDPINRKRFSEDILVKGSEVVQFSLEEHGLQSWRVRTNTKDRKLMPR